MVSIGKVIGKVAGGAVAGVAKGAAKATVIPKLAPSTKPAVMPKEMPLRRDLGNMPKPMPKRQTMPLRTPETRDNRITNDLVQKGKLPRSRAEIYNNPNPNQMYGAKKPMGSSSQAEMKKLKDSFGMYGKAR